jgi:hypothetical protein
MNCLRPLKRWGREFESHARHESPCVCLFCACVVLRVGSGLTTSSSPFQGVLPSVYGLKKLRNWPRPNKELYSHNNNNNNNNMQNQK